MSTRFYCPHCGALNQHPGNLAGRVLHCGACSGEVLFHRQPERRCVGCNRRVVNVVACAGCGEEYCSEVCLRRHLKAAVHPAPSNWTGRLAGCLWAIAILAALAIAGLVIQRQRGQEQPPAPRQQHSNDGR
ncbi:MAG: hypothetical protein IT429_26430 [Gemmataceae bacterium]|nr:hypothetical protein [Gemmataceae bacterium]